MDKPTKIYTFLKQRKTIERLDVFPFFFIYSLALIVCASLTLNSIVKLIIFALIVIAQGVTFFSKFWFDNVMAKICYHTVNSIDKATHIKVEIKSEKFKMNNRISICQVIRQGKFITIEFEKVILIYDEGKQTFIRPRFNLKGKLLKDFLTCKPLQTADIPDIRCHYGDNRMKLPIPSFFALYKEHVVAPFFVFQLFCILLLIFDDYGLSSFFTLFMLCVFEATVVGQRIFNLATLRKMRVPPHKIFVYRNNAWVKIPSNELLPGDVVSVVDGSNYETVEEEEDEETKNNFILQILKRLKEVKKKTEERRNQKSVNTVLNKHKEKEPSPLTCDMLLLAGSAIVNEAMLTGESVPQIKDSIRKLDNEYEKELDVKLHHKKCVLFAGTKVVKVSRNDEIEKMPEGIKTAPPDRGCICLVIRTGFSTSQGKLLRTVLYSSERNKGGDTKEAFIFIAVLLCIALGASYYVLIDGLEREGELTYKLLLRCIIIITSVVPAELPIELSLNINSSLFFLQSKRIVCIEPFRIPFAGKIDICCFDKTGTLTKDEFIMRGLVYPNSNEITKSNATNEETLSVLLGCNSLININNKSVGDPIEVAMFKDAEGKFDKDIITCAKRTKVMAIRTYQFDSELKRMTVLARIYSGVYDNVKYNRVLCKGAPEAIKTLLKEVPSNYDKCYTKWAKEGYRILALAYKDDESLVYSSKREDVEKDLHFAGFAIVETPLKQKVEKNITELIQAEYDVCIITGDHLLTTSKVAKDLKLGPSEFALLKVENNKVNWYDLDNNFIRETKDIDEVKSLFKTHTLGLTGRDMEELEALQTIKDKHLMFQYFKLFCRVSPSQKDDIIKNMIKSGRNPSMCGDGANDVGALKRATIGIALLNIEETKTQKKQQFNILSFDDDTTIKSGDVTSAAPFTSKSSSIRCVKNIMIQGRCTLVVSFQMYKILALNCLLSAYSLSVLALRGVKYSEYQALYMGFAIAIFFLMLSRGQPLKKLNPNKPPTTIFTKEAIISILGQAVVNLGCMIGIIYYTSIVDPVAYGEVKSLDDEFTPTMMNTIMFLHSLVNQTITLVVNYTGEPFMENMSKNSTLLKMVWGIVLACLIIVFDVYPPLNEMLELLPLPEDMTYKCSLVGIMFANFILCYLFENWKKVLGYYKL